MTGGLAAPFLAAGTGAIIGTAGAAVIGSGAGAALIGSAFGVGGAGLIGYRMKRRVGGLEQFEFEPLFPDPGSLFFTRAWVLDDAVWEPVQVFLIVGLASKE